jgi:nitrate reductase NapAB chaperone NapD
MPVCSYVVIPEPGATDGVLRQLNALPRCEATRAENRDVILLVTDTADMQEEQAMATALGGVEGILTMVLAFGDIEEGSEPVQLGGRGMRRNGGVA